MDTCTFGNKKTILNLRQEDSEMETRKVLLPASMGPMRLRNRVVMAPLSTNFPSASGEITPEYTGFYLARAKGGVGLIIVEWANVDFPLGKGGYTQTRLDDDAFIPSFREFTEIIHETGAKVCLQLNHSGGMFGDRGRSELRPISASELEYGKNHKLARAATLEEIHALQNKFIMAAERAQMAGFDAVEVHGAASYLIANFLSPWTNLRTDEYGGSTVNRARFAVEIVEGIRKKCGPQFPILFRISGDEMVPEGRHLEETVEIVRLLKQAGVTCVHVTAGAARIPQLPARRAHIGPTGSPQGWKSYLAREVRAQCDIPVIAVDTIRDVEVAEQIVQTDADFVAMARELIAEPDWVNKALTGGNIRKCVSCNSCVLHRSMFGGKLRCCVNPMAGKEYRLPLPDKAPAERKQKVAVVGGGPGGMQAAITAAQRGHQVTLYEKNSELGGELIPACGADLKYKYRWIIDWQRKELETWKVDVHLGQEAAAEELLNSDYEVIIVATGSNPRMFSPIREYYAEHSDDPKWMTATDYLAGIRKVPQGAVRALVLGAGDIGQEASMMLAKAGLQVKLLEGYRTKDNLVVGDVNNGMELLDAVIASGVEIIDHVKLLSVSDTQIETTIADEPTALPYDVVVIAQGLVPNDGLLKQLDGCPKRVIPVGNVIRDRTAFYAIQEGFNAGYYL